MPEILQEFPIATTSDLVFDGLTLPAFLDRWWTLRSAGRPEKGTVYELDFGPGFIWRAVVTAAIPCEKFKLTFRDADDDWSETTVCFDLKSTASGTLVSFSHRGWREANSHFRTTSHCWALYFRILRRHLEHGEVVPYDQRLVV